MHLSDFDYDLPSEMIAQTPAEPRDSSRLLAYERAGGRITHRTFRELPELLRPSDILVLNDTKVIPARLTTTEGREVFLVRRQNTENKTQIWLCLVRGGKHFEVNTEFEIASDLKGKVLEVLDSGERTIEFMSSDFETALEKYGASPLPPYIRQTQKKEPRYQTIFAENPGSVAAPTAGLHFTPRIFKALEDKGITIEKVTLHVGLGTFLPVKVEKIEEHDMHSEFFELPTPVAKRLNKAKKLNQRIIAVGSTSCRVLESCTDPTGKLSPKIGETDIFIYPDYKFKFIDGLLTNFHLPKSTLIMLVSALIGREKTLELYNLAIHEKYRFYSFGDVMLLT